MCTHAALIEFSAGLVRYDTQGDKDKKWTFLPRTEGHVVKLLKNWVGRERIIWGRVWNKYAKLYPEAFPLPHNHCAAVDSLNATVDNPENCDSTDAPRVASLSCVKKKVTPDAAKLRSTMVKQLLAEHRRHIAIVPHEDGIDHVEQLAEQLKLSGNNLARTVLSTDFYSRYDQLHAAAHNLGEMSSTSTVARV
eukprot:COSAG02_NODE_26278_length_636_cov_1.046555_1_plen_192_part_10